MYERLAALGLLMASSLGQTVQVPQRIAVTVANVGDDLNLTCSIPAGVWIFYWYKINFGYMIQTFAAAGEQHAVEKKNPRIKVIKVDNVLILAIQNVSKDDEATYFCQMGEAYKMQFINGSVLSVNDHKNVQQRQVYVKQSPESESVREGDSVTLQCSLLFENKENKVQCPDEHSVHWFRNGSVDTDPGILYTRSINSSRRINDEEENKSCIYSLSKTIHNPSDTGTYYCAVVTCGQILYGKGTRVETRPELLPYVIVLGCLLLYCIGATIALIHCTKKRFACEHCKGRIIATSQAPNDTSADDQASNQDGDTMELNYAALDFSARKAKRGKTNRDFSQECIYSNRRELK